MQTRYKWFNDYMERLGWQWTATMRIGSGCKVHLHEGELHIGRLIVSVSKHYTAVIDSVIHDIYNPRLMYWLHEGQRWMRLNNKLVKRVTHEEWEFLREYLLKKP